VSEQGSRSERIGEIINRAFTWIQQPANQLWVQQASTDFFPVGRELAPWAQQWLMTLFPTWLLYDYRGADGKTGLERYEAEFGGEIPKGDRKLLQRVKGERFRLCTLDAVVPGQGVTLRDLTTREDLEVRDRTAGERLQPGTLCFVRIRRIGNRREIDALAVVPASLRGQLQQRIADLVAARQAEAPEFTEEELFRTAAPKLFNLALEVVQEFAPPSEVQSMPSSEKEIMKRAVADHFARWMDAPLEGLGNRSPRQAAEDPELREELRVLLKELEDRTKDDPDLDLDVDDLRRELGLLE